MKNSDYLTEEDTVSIKEPCSNCDGTGGVDSGGFTPWGAGIDVPCPACNGSGFNPITTPKNPVGRPVTIETTERAHFVVYADRQFKQRHCAAQFDARDKSRESVAEWISNNPKIHLAENETDKH